MARVLIDEELEFDSIKKCISRPFFHASDNPCRDVNFLVLYRIMYGNRAMEVQRRNNFIVGSDNTEIWGPWRLLVSWWNKLNN